MPTEDPELTTEEAADRLGASQRTIQRLADRGTIRRRRYLDGTVRYYAADIDRIAADYRPRSRTLGVSA